MEKNWYNRNMKIETKYNEYFTSLTVSDKYLIEFLRNWFLVEIKNLPCGLGSDDQIQFLLTKHHFQ